MDKAGTLDVQLLMILEKMKKLGEEINGELPSIEEYIKVSAFKQ